ncbi:MAG: arginine--tRNA ligase [Promethearchaeota archaeon]|nr:MAG: arginine--tRNA ligase [Candidatus Lokiarchaeota archaeon]
MDYQLEIASLISDLTSIPIDRLQFLIKEPTKGVDTDYSINWFALKSHIKKDGNQIADELEQNLQKITGKHHFIHTVSRVGPYINFKLNDHHVFQELRNQIDTQFNKFVHSGFPDLKKLTVVIEYPAQNTNKPLHLGHVRNMILGQTLASLHIFAGNSVHQVNLMNDKGVHICKSMLAYKRWGKGTTPEKRNMKSDHFVGKYYVTYGKHELKLREEVANEIKQLDEEKKKPLKEQDSEKIHRLDIVIQQSKYGKLIQNLNDLLLKWENGDPDVRKIWNKMNSWAKNGFEETYKVFDIQHEKVYLESDIYDKGREIVLDGVQKEHFIQLEDGAIIARFNKKGLPKEKVLLRRDGTTLYITQDLYLANQKLKDYNFDESIYVIGNEQDMQLRILFELLAILGFTGNNVHYSYGMINLKSGKMKSREGTVVDADNVVHDIKALSLEEVKNRYKDLSESEMSYRARVIAMAALRFFILKYEYSRDFVFDLEESISFEGETGVYLLYVYARICSIFTKGLEQGIPVPYSPNEDKMNDWTHESIPEEISTPEHNLLILLSKYPITLSTTCTTLKPHILCRYLLELAQSFNNFYHECPILKEEGTLRDFRLSICELVRKVMKHGLQIIKIDVITEM